MLPLSFGLLYKLLWKQSLGFCRFVYAGIPFACWRNWLPQKFTVLFSIACLIQLIG